MPNAAPRKSKGVVSHGLDDASQTWLAILNQMPVGVTVVEVPDGRFILQNSAAVRILGRVPGPGEPADTYLRYDAGQERRPYEPDEFPLSRAVATGEMVEREPMYYRRPDGQLIILEVNASRVEAGHGRRLGVCTFQDVTAEYKGRRELKESAERVELALDAGAIVGTFVWDVATDLITADELFAKSFGLDPEVCRTGVPSGTTLLSVHPTDRLGVETAVTDALARGGAYRHQYRVLQQDGAYRWIEASGRVEMDAAGRPIRFPGVLLDITAWKHADEARNLLMREVDHRARNALATVQSVVRLTDASDPAHYREEVLGRVDAMARAQGSLSRTNWEGAILEDVVREELAAYASPVQFAVTGPKLTVAAEQVQSLNMIIHEMVTNAVKYGALSAPGGRIEVSWRAEHLGDPEVIWSELIWTERGGPPVSPPERKGFGSRLVARLSNQLGGSIDIDWQPAGVHAKLRWRA
jgi:two-component sensor histidine kinase